MGFVTAEVLRVGVVTGSGVGAGETLTSVVFVLSFSSLSPLAIPTSPLIE